MFLEGGGREEYIYQLSKKLAERNNNVTIITSDYAPTGKESIGKKARSVSGIFIKTLKGYPVSVPPGRIAISDLLDYILKYNEYDIINAHGMGEEVVTDALYAAKIKNIPFVFTPHFHPYWAYEKLNAKKTWQVLQEIQTRMVIHHADATIVFSEQTKKDLMKYSGISNPKNIRIIPDGIDETLPYNLPQKKVKEIFDKYGIPPAENYIMFLGDATNPRKGAFIAVQAFRQVKWELPNTHFIITGPWSTRLNPATSSAQNKFIQLLNKLIKTENATVTDYVDDFDKAALLIGSDLLLSPTVYESFGMVLAEALYCRTPVVATKIGGVIDTVRDDIDGILVRGSDNIQGFARACIKLLKNKDKAKKMGEEGHKRVKEKFLWSKSSRKVEKLYKELVMKHKKELKK